MKKIVFHASILKGDLTGLGFYALTFIQALEEHFKDKNVSITIYANGKFYDNLQEYQTLTSLPTPVAQPPTSFAHSLKIRVRRVLLKMIKMILSEHFYLALKKRLLPLLQKLKRMLQSRANRSEQERTEIFDLYIEPSYEIAVLNAKKTLGCIHDLPLCDEKAWRISESLKAFLIEQVLPKMATFTETICFSEYTKTDILKTFGFSQERVHVIYHGLRKYRENRIEALPPHFGDFILVVGARARRRNVRGLIDAFKLLPAPLQHRFKVMITGAPNDLSQDDEAYFKQNFIVDLGYVTDALLQTLYTHAHLLWWGSFAEGFGLPMVEAMQAQCVVLASNVSCMPEILGDAGIYCNPYDVTDIAKQLEIALTDETLRRQCVQKGLERVKKFDFQESMRKHIEIVERMLEDKSTP
ncbi:glycosyltransferase family 4 protein [Helicobacter cynogastricus]|uniref:glycosyltransferase family 4 protein n=1 Tax=Helicobacter cynogastricus TaxID=329937 RepID=UPI001F20C847|nr:glycosyltransferase family 1 protein [Helicobacter cynogastricus]